MATTTQYSPGFGAAGGNLEGLPTSRTNAPKIKNKGKDKHAVNDLRRQARKGFKSHSIEGSALEEKTESRAEARREGDI